MKILNNPKKVSSTSQHRLSTVKAAGVQRSSETHQQQGRDHSTVYSGSNHRGLSQRKRNAETGVHVNIHEDLKCRATQNWPTRGDCARDSGVLSSSSTVPTQAKRMRVRPTSQQEQIVQQQLRQRRVHPDQIKTERLQKVLAFSGLGSRREMEMAIESGRILVNGKIAILGQSVGPDDRVDYNGKLVSLKWKDRLPRIVIYHKQEGELVSRKDPKGRLTVFDRLPQLASSRWVAVGRLDFNTSGLLLFTTSGDLANHMMHPRFEVEREYAVRVRGELTPEQIKQFMQGIQLDDGIARFDRLIQGGGEGQNRWYHIVLREGRNREVRRMFEYLGLTVSRLMRIRFGAFTLPPRLKRGEFYELTETEIEAALKWANLSMNGQEKSER